MRYICSYFENIKISFALPLILYCYFCTNLGGMAPSPYYSKENIASEGYSEGAVPPMNTIAR